MAYEPYEWQDGEYGRTPITADQLNRMEAGISEAHELGGEDAEPPTWGEVADKPDTFPAEDHEHSVSEVDGLTEALNEKADASAVASLESTISDLTARLDALEADSGTES